MGSVRCTIRVAAPVDTRIRLRNCSFGRWLFSRDVHYMAACVTEHTRKLARKRVACLILVISVSVAYAAAAQAAGRPAGRNRACSSRSDSLRRNADLCHAGGGAIACACLMQQGTTHARRWTPCRPLQHVRANASRFCKCMPVAMRVVTMAASTVERRDRRHSVPSQASAARLANECGCMCKRLARPAQPAAGRRVHAIRPERNEAQQHATSARHWRRWPGRRRAGPFSTVRKPHTHLNISC